MTFLAHYKKQIEQNVFVNKPKWRSSYLDSMVRSVLVDGSNPPISKPKESKALVEYCMNHDIQTVDRKSYLSIIQFIHLNLYHNAVEGKLKKLIKNINADLADINALQDEVTIGINPDVNKEEALEEIQGIKKSILINKLDVDKLFEKKQSIDKQLQDLNIYFKDMNIQHKSYESSVNAILEPEREKISEILHNLYDRDEHNQLSGFVFAIKEGYKQSLKGRDLRSMLDDMSIAIVANTVGSPSYNIKGSARQSIAKDVIDNLKDSEELFKDLELDVSDLEMASMKLNGYLNMMIAIHNFLALHPSEKILKNSFVRKMAKITFE